MKLNAPAILLFFWLGLPAGMGDARFLAAQIVLSQVRAIYITRQAESRLSQDLSNDEPGAWRDFLLGFWVDPGNATANAYLGLLAPAFDLLNRHNREPITERDLPLDMAEIRRKIASDEFELSRQAANQAILRQIRGQEMQEAMANGQIVADDASDQSGDCYLISGLTQAGRRIHLQCRNSTQSLIQIITLYEPDPARGTTTTQAGASIPIMSSDWQAPLVEQRVTYTLELNGQFFLIENVPARVDQETGEQFFSPAIVEELQQIILNGQAPERVITTPVYRYNGGAG